MVNFEVYIDLMESEVRECREYELIELMELMKGKQLIRDQMESKAKIEMKESEQWH